MNVKWQGGGGGINVHCDDAEESYSDGQLAEEQWTLNVCIACGDTVMKGIGKPADSCVALDLSKRYGQLHARAEAAEQQLRDVEEAVKVHFKKIIEVWHRGTDDTAEAIGLSRAEYAAFLEERQTPLQLILKRASTEGERDE